MDSINAKTILSNLTGEGSTPKYYLKPVGTTNVSFEQLANLVATKSALPLSTVKYALETCNQKLIDLLATNCRVHTGVYVASLGIGGSVGSIGEQPNKVDNPVHAVLTPEGDIVDVLKAITVNNIAVTVAAILNEVQEADCLVLNKLTAANKNVVINGSCIKVDSTKTDEGVWLADKATGVLVKSATIVSSDSARTIVKFATLPTDGQYRLVLATRNGEADMDVTTVSRLVTVETAA